MADDSNRIGATRLSTGLGQVRPLPGAGGSPASDNTGNATIQASGGGSASAHHGAFGPRGSRMLPADYPLDQLDRRAARGTYLDILV